MLASRISVWFRLIINLVLLCNVNSSTSLNYIPILLFDFPNNDIPINSANPEADCDTQADKCVGFNTEGILKYDLQNPSVGKSKGFYVHRVKYGMKFIRLASNLASLNLIDMFIL